jgi:hypothetical protein
MRVVDSSISISTAHFYQEYTEAELSVTAWRDGRSGVARQGGARPSGGAGPGRQDLVTVSEEARKPLENRQVALEEPELKTEGDVKTEIIRLVMEKMTGRRMRLVSLEDLGCRRECQGAAEKAERTVPSHEGRSAGWGLVVDYHERHEETEATTFHAEGVINTVDGRQICFDVELGMTRQFMEENSLQIRMGDALKDPLVVNFHGNAAQLTDTEFHFDLDSDGAEEPVSFLQSGSGFLALDRNNDGIVNNGSELFGPATGQGFAELARYDDDGNGWIDENDPIYHKLRIWMRDGEGNDSLLALGQVGVGAICLANAETPFALKDGGNDLLGQVRATGIYANEDGTVGTIQQIDIAC